MEYLLLGLSLGLAAGISPGPLLTLVVTSTLERGFGAGLLVALAPILTDTPIILLALLVLGELPGTALAAITIAGGLFVIWIGVKTVLEAARGLPPDEEARPGATDLRRGMLVNILSPHPWIFWATVGGPILLEAWRRQPLYGVAYLAAFYLTIVGSKVAIALLTARGRRLLAGRGYAVTLATAGVILIALGLLLVYQGAAELIR